MGPQPNLPRRIVVRRKVGVGVEEESLTHTTLRSLEEQREQNGRPTRVLHSAEEALLSVKDLGERTSQSMAASSEGTLPRNL